MENSSRWWEIVLQGKVIAYLLRTTVRICCQRHGPDGLKIFQLKQVLYMTVAVQQLCIVCLNYYQRVVTSWSLRSCFLFHYKFLDDRIKLVPCGYMTRQGWHLTFWDVSSRCRRKGKQISHLPPCLWQFLCSCGTLPCSYCNLNKLVLYTTCFNVFLCKLKSAGIVLFWTVYDQLYCPKLSFEKANSKAMVK